MKSRSPIIKCLFGRICFQKRRNVCIINLYTLFLVVNSFIICIENNKYTNIKILLSMDQYHLLTYIYISLSFVYPGSVSVYSAHEFPIQGVAGAAPVSSSPLGGGGGGALGTSGSRTAVHERSHSDTPTPLPSVDLSAESSSVTSLSNLTAPLRKNMASGK